MTFTLKTKGGTAAKLGGGIYITPTPAVPAISITPGTTIEEPKSNISKLSGGKVVLSDVVKKVDSIETVIDGPVKPPKSDAATVSVYAAYSPDVATTKGTSDVVPTTIPAFTPIESLTGISDVKPIIVSATDFLPAFDANKNENNTFTLLKNQFGLRNLRAETIVSLFKKVDRKYSQATNDYVSLSDRNSAFLNEFKEQKSIVRAAYDYLSNVEAAVSVLDLRNRFWENVTDNNVKNSLDNLFVDLGLKGYNSYSSSKRWAQLVLFVKEMIRTNSSILQGDPLPALEGEPEQKALDIERPLAGKFSFPIDSKILPLSGIDKLTSIEEAFRLLDESRVIYANTQTHYPLDQASKVSVIANALSKELYISSNLSDENVKSDLLAKFGYTVSQTGGNIPLLDSVFGKFGNKVTDFTNDETTLYGASHISIANEGVAGSAGVLVFETSYIKDGTKVLTPGSDYYVGKYLTPPDENFNIVQLGLSMNNLNAKLVGAKDRLDIVKKVLLPHLYNEFGVTVSNPQKLIDLTGAELLNDTKSSLSSKYGSVTPALFKLAVEDVDFKSILFCYVMTVARKRSIALQNAFFSLISKKLKEKKYAGSTLLNTDVSEATLIASMKYDQPLIKYVVDNINFYVDWLYSNKAYSVSRFTAEGSTETTDVLAETTLFSNQINTAVLMMAFDLMTQIIGGFTTSEFVAYSTGKYYLKIPTALTPVVPTLNWDSIINKLSNEQKALSSGFGLMNDILSNTSRVFGDFGPKNEIANRFFTKFTGEGGLSSLMFNRQQIDLLSDRITVIERLLESGKPVPNDEVVVRLVDESYVPPEEYNALVALLSTSEMTESAYNKKILSVGLPYGFVRSLRRIIEGITPPNSYSDKQYDIINLNVYKVDGNFPNIIYKPLKYPFEVSRFPARYAGDFDAAAAGEVSLQNFLGMMTTYDAEEFVRNKRYKLGDESLGKALATYYPTDPINQGRVSFSSQSYDFLDASTKQALHRNHVMSYMLELYMRLLTGLPVSEQYFYYADPSCLETSYLRSLTRGVLGLIADPNGGSSTTIPQLDVALNSISEKSSAAASHALGLVSDLSRTLSNVSSPVAFRTKMVTPRRFDRVFHLLVDPDEFEIDIEKTNSYAAGKSSLSSLEKAGYVYAAEDGKYYDREHGEKDIVHVRYYVTFTSLTQGYEIETSTMIM